MENVILANIDAILYGVGLFTILTIFMPYSPMTIDLLMLPRGLQVGIYRHRRILWVIVYACLGAVLLRAAMGVSEPVWLTTILITIGMMAFMFWSGYVPYVMTPPAKPKLLDIAEADKILKPDEWILGVVNGDDARAYPRDTIARPHYFPDTVGGEKLTISYCILCNSSMGFKNQLDGREIDLQCVTAYNNNIIYLDPEKGNYIQQLDGVVFHGPDKGKALEQFPVVQATWEEWKRLHPNTKLYYSPAATLRDKMVAIMLGMMIPISSLSKRKKPWHRIRGKLDKRLPAMSYVTGVEINGEVSAYPISTLEETPVINDTVGGEPIVVLYDKNHDVGDVFFRKVDGRVLNFTRDGSGNAIARDEETGTLWDVTGTAREGQLANQSLQRVPHYSKLFWFSWALFKPDTRVKLAT